MDEPFGALDALTRASLQDELIGVMEKTGATVVMVTHDVDEAVLLSDRVVMMTNGPAATHRRDPRSEAPQTPRPASPWPTTPTSSNAARRFWSSCIRSR